MSLDYSHIDASKSFEPTEQYEVLRSQCPVHHVAEHDPPFYVVSRFDDVVNTLKQPDLWTNGTGPGVFYQESGVLGTTDEPDHQRHRHVLRDAFLPTSIARLEPRIAAIADHYLDQMLPLGEGDFVALYAAPLPADAISELFGVPEGEREGFREAADDIASALSGGDLALYEPAKKRLGDAIDRGIVVREALLDGAGAPAEESVIGTVLPDDVLSRLAVARRTCTITPAHPPHTAPQVHAPDHDPTPDLGLGLGQRPQRRHAGHEHGRGHGHEHEHEHGREQHRRPRDRHVGHVDGRCHGQQQQRQHDRHDRPELRRVRPAERAMRRQRVRQAVSGPGPGPLRPRPCLRCDLRRG